MIYELSDGVEDQAYNDHPFTMIGPGCGELGGLD